ncbi:PREDICTED: uncharacterized protein LOC105144707 [Acromyrmex echinatior]|uniref:uncharacterized protein LOC105144707 n=1 Tax=Acromyrmex echinatior TaxID=103372 RepID=UPI000580E2B9|nr:PREDICTED: uncharacterized protein LOC105144707 [Acromyrmex echinatior]
MAAAQTLAQRIRESTNRNFSFPWHERKDFHAAFLDLRLNLLKPRENSEDQGRIVDSAGSRHLLEIKINESTTATVGTTNNITITKTATAATARTTTAATARTAIATNESESVTNARANATETAIPTAATTITKPPRWQRGGCGHIKKVKEIVKYVYISIPRDKHSDSRIKYPEDKRL